MTCPFCQAPNDATAIACARCGRVLPYQEPRSPEWQRSIGWAMVWSGFWIAFIQPEIVEFAFLLNAAGWALFLEDDWVLRVLLGLMMALVMCGVGVALGERLFRFVGIR